VKRGWKYAVLGVALLAFGTARLPFEARLNRQLRTAGLFPQPLEIGTTERIGQTSSAVALGGLRTLVATFLNLRAFTYFTEQRWTDVESTFGMIVDLAPRTRYYWETGAWHMAYNAAAYYLNDSKLPPLRRREAWRSSILKGRSFLERGVRNNPDDWSILANLGFLLSDANKLHAFRDPNEAFAAAADAYRRAHETGNALPYVRRSWLYALARVEGREDEALSLARKLYADGPQNRTPTLMVLLFVLEARENPDMDLTARAIELFGTAEKAYDALSGHWLRTRERFPVHGVSAAMESLEKKLSIPPEKSIFKQPMAPPAGPDEWFRD
jgi:tetratricopeptide (TPR) repeat protein